ncbi:MAG: RimK/LysX family protein [Planctomycetota bacterium]
MAIRGPFFWLVGGLTAAALLPAARETLSPQESGASQPVPMTIGPVAPITVATSGVTFEARVDTGAAVTSLHCPPDWVEIVDAEPDPFANIGKPIRLRLENRDGKEAWIDTRITDYVEVRSANGAEHRYRIRLPLSFGDVVKETIVNLKDRSSMTHRMLLGRDFLAGDFSVDVSAGS